MQTGEALTRATAVAAFLCYVVALTLRLGKRLRWSRVLWSMGCVALVIHVGCAFEFVHHWSHQAAYAATAQQTAAVTGFNSGSGLWLNYLLVAVWLADVGYWWRAGQTHEFRSRRMEWAVQGLLGFMWFNATVVFGHGPARWLGVVAVVWLAVAVVRRGSGMRRVEAT